MRLSALLLTLFLLAPVPADASGETIAQRLAELRHRRSELGADLATLERRVAEAERSFQANAAALEAARGEHVGRLEELAAAREELRGVRRRLEARIREMYVEGSPVELFLSLGSPAEVERAAEYLAAAARRDTALVRGLRVRRRQVERLEAEAAGRVEEAERRHADSRRRYLALRADQEAIHQEAGLLDRRIERLTASWSEERYLLAVDLVEELGVDGRLREETLAQASLRASLPLGPTVGVPPGFVSTEVLRGVASWYGPGFHGRRTSSGALFDERDYTAAHKTLPFGTLLLVGYRDRQVVVMVNDRGPYVGDRRFDLSRAAAEYLGLGLGMVSAEILVPAGG